jgi:hypothetical protein
MSKALNKLVVGLIHGKEFSKGLIINIVGSHYVDRNLICYDFSIDNVGNVPYNLVIVGINLQDKIKKINNDYLALDLEITVKYYKQPEEQIDIYQIFSPQIDKKEIIHLNNKFNINLAGKLNEDITQLDIGEDDNKNILYGKFLPKVEISDRGNCTTFELYFNIKKTEKDISKEDALKLVNSEYNTLDEKLRNCIESTEEIWLENFYIISSEIDFSYGFENDMSFCTYINLF